MAHADGPGGEGPGRGAETADIRGLVLREAGEGFWGWVLVEALAEAREVSREGVVVGLSDLGCLVVFSVLEVLPAVAAAAVGFIGSSCVCAVFVVAPRVANAIVVDAAVRRVVVVVVESAGGCGDWRKLGS